MISEGNTMVGPVLPVTVTVAVRVALPDALVAVRV